MEPDDEDATHSGGARDREDSLESYTSDDGDSSTSNDEESPASEGEGSSVYGDCDLDDEGEEDALEAAPDR